MSDIVTYSRQGNVGVLTIDNPPVNAMGHGVRAGLAEGIKTALADDAAKAVVVRMTAGSHPARAARTASTTPSGT